MFAEWERHQALKPPLGPIVEIDYRDPLSRGITSYWAFTENGGRRVNDLVGRRLGTIVTPAQVSWGVGDRGNGIKCTAGAAVTNGISLTGAANQVSAGTLFTWAALVNPSTAADTFAGLQGSSGTVTIPTFYDSSGFLDYWNGTADQYSSIQVVRGVTRSYAVTQTSTAVGAATLFVNGKSAGTADGVNWAAGGEGPLSFMFNDTGSFSMAGMCYYIGTWNRVLTQQELTQLAQEPFSILRTRPYIRFYDMVGVVATSSGGGAAAGFTIPTRTLLGVGR